MIGWGSRHGEPGLYPTLRKMDYLITVSPRRLEGQKGRTLICLLTVSPGCLAQASDVALPESVRDESRI